KLTQLRAVTYNWKDELNLTSDTQIGLIAQELEEHFPHLVNTDSEGYKSIQYGKLSAVLLEGMKEQQMRIVGLESENDELRDMIIELQIEVELLKN
ncbi:MAG: tail fiber domain-containing protein, partial [Patescibacteria group bacterium]|nr:tail fiber domain-containing protein [Patescibacteria group bacterium]